MAENAKIAALRASTPNAPQGGTAPQALAYEWMSRRGADLVMPDRKPVDQQAWRDSRQPKAPPGRPVIRPPSNPFNGGKSILPPEMPPMFGDGDRMRSPVSEPVMFGGEPVEDYGGRMPRYQNDFAMPPVGDMPSYGPSFNFYTGDLSYADIPVPAVDAPATTAPAESPRFDYSTDSIMPTGVEEFVMPMPVPMPYTPIAQPSVAPAPAPAPAESPDAFTFDPAVVEMLRRSYQSPYLARNGLLSIE